VSIPLPNRLPFVKDFVVIYHVLIRPCLAQLSFTSEAVFLVFSSMNCFTGEAKLFYSLCLAKHLHMMDKRTKITALPLAFLFSSVFLA
jgi:hypothetical protein